MSHLYKIYAKQAKNMFRKNVRKFCKKVLTKWKLGYKIVTEKRTRVQMTKKKIKWVYLEEKKM